MSVCPVLACDNVLKAISVRCLQEAAGFGARLKRNIKIGQSPVQRRFNVTTTSSGLLKRRSGKPLLPSPRLTTMPVWPS